ncbi:hypothetical protein MesoLjLc_51830 [Mesorhizobium sp. L-8-10]|uniref:hypothetical protein n=1 Tax=Mesorhizobium sp. L-8-10 TaxID=2744523 RepID=UPI00192830CF|nr:hypothetical protein [Mesorhizobium sp. L-8-10]BCH33253.1 hypothetical protein MesoLjLc_51830 [Mesorhizobium sp. L-8-10]
MADSVTNALADLLTAWEEMAPPLSDTETFAQAIERTPRDSRAATILFSTWRCRACQRSGFLADAILDPERDTVSCSICMTPDQLDMLEYMEMVGRA